MPSEMKLVIFDTNKVVQSVSREIDNQQFVESIQDFQLVANETLTKIIEGVCQGSDTNDYDMDQEEESSEDEDLPKEVTPKKRRH